MHSEVIEVFNEGLVIGKPSSGPKKLVLEITSKCNLNCPMCFRNSWSEIEGSMSEKLLMKILDEAREARTNFIWFSGWGEPLYHEKAFEYAEEVKNRGFKLGINTNGTLLDEENALKLVKIGVDRIAVSIDAASIETYRKIRGGELGKIVLALKTIHRARKLQGTVYPVTELIFTAMKSNIGELTELIELAEKCGAGRIIVSNLIPVKREHEAECLYLSDEIDFNEIAGQIAIKSLETNVAVRLPEFKLKTERKCPFINEMAACITWNGKVTPCLNFLHTYKCHIYGVEKQVSQVVFGDLNRESLTDVWRKTEYLAFRFKVKYFTFPSCTDCKFHEICDFTLTNNMDCWGNAPSCADCLYARNIVQCPL